MIWIDLHLDVCVLFFFIEPIGLPSRSIVRTPCHHSRVAEFDSQPRLRGRISSGQPLSLVESSQCPKLALVSESRLSHTTHQHTLNSFPSVCIISESRNMACFIFLGSEEIMALNRGGCIYSAMISCFGVVVREGGGGAI